MTPPVGPRAKGMFSPEGRKAIGENGWENIHGVDGRTVYANTLRGHDVPGLAAGKEHVLPGGEKKQSGK